jgi:hypothetical protein
VRIFNPSNLEVNILSEASITNTTMDLGEVSWKMNFYLLQNRYISLP